MKKTVLVTGASGEIGREIAKVFAKEGYKVAIHYNNNEKAADELKALLLNNGAEAEIFKADLLNNEEVRSLAAAVIEKMGRIDVLINNAGASLIKPFLDTEDSEGAELVSLNLVSAMALSKYAAEDMLKRKSGRIINISSVWGLSGASCEVYYSASKAGMIGFTKALASELAPSGITVNAVAPGVIDTRMNAHLNDIEKDELASEIPAGRFGNGYDVAKLVLFLASSDADYITGQAVNISGGFLI